MRHVVLVVACEIPKPKLAILGLVASIMHELAPGSVVGVPVLLVHSDGPLIRLGERRSARAQRLHERRFTGPLAPDKDQPQPWGVRLYGA